MLNLMDYNTKIVEGMQIGKIDAFTTIFDEVKNAVKQANYLSLKELLHIEKEYQLLSEHWLKKYEISYNAQSHYEKALAAFFDVKGRFDFDRYMNRKQREIVRFLNIVKRDKQKNNRDIIYEIEQFLQMNYDRDVKLQEIAERFYLSREYISRKFKQEFQENISDYIVKVRMSKAKSLLKNEQLKIYEVANMIGYQDDKYFRKVFKKLEGLTPNEYRQLSV
ncbi:helix-turn-helix domain-containing protein [Priestia flexa]|uniref:helix-turn-helix domain-containing protein n=1 Tax=Priestia flexa TaxID=86664 RepID=UPI00240D2F7A|nr:AraC family transcriptional regulator [Priestia flexa]WEZ08266.1 AraC family transcriptional regulator [Priestia flexa]